MTRSPSSPPPPPLANTSSHRTVCGDEMSHRCCCLLLAGSSWRYVHEYQGFCALNSHPTQRIIIWKWIRCNYVSVRLSLYATRVYSVHIKVGIHIVYVSCLQTLSATNLSRQVKEDTNGVHTPPIPHRIALNRINSLLPSVVVAVFRNKAHIQGQRQRQRKSESYFGSRYVLQFTGATDSVCRVCTQNVSNRLQIFFFFFGIRVVAAVACCRSFFTILQSESVGSKLYHCA